jgi:hypothetical protein
MRMTMGLKGKGCRIQDYSAVLYTGFDSAIGVSGFVYMIASATLNLELFMKLNGMVC